MKYEPLFRKILNKDYLYVNSNFLEDEINRIKKDRIENIFILSSENYQIDNMDWLSEVGKDVESIIITPRTNIEFSYLGLSYCTNLKRLRINNEVDVPIDLSSNGNVEILSMLKYKKVSGIDKLSNLKSLTLTRHIPNTYLSKEWFSGFPALSNLSLLGINLSKGFGFLSSSNIRSLIIFNSRDVSMEGILNMNLETLEIDRCKNIRRQELIFQLKSLKTLKLIDSITIDSPERFLELPNLKMLVMTGTSVIEKGNLSCLKGKLSHFGFDNKRHYDTKYEKFRDNYLIEKDAQKAI